MDFIERLFGTAPDAGNGMLELAIFSAGIVIVAAWLLVRRLIRRRV
jgi:hypothetical protein